MSETLSLEGMPQAVPNIDSKDIRFVLTVSGQEAIQCTASYGVAAQIASGLGSALRLIGAALEKDGDFVQIGEIKLSRADATKDEWSDTVHLRLTDVHGVPYLFPIPSETALALAEKLKSEGSRATRTGNA